MSEEFESVERTNIHLAANCRGVTLSGNYSKPFVNAQYVRASEFDKLLAAYRAVVPSITTMLRAEDFTRYRAIVGVIQSPNLAPAL